MEAIGDAYLAVATGDLHATRVAALAIDMLHAAGNVEVDLPSEAAAAGGEEGGAPPCAAQGRLRIRIGLHTAPGPAPDAAGGCGGEASPFSSSSSSAFAADKATIAVSCAMQRPGYPQCVHLSGAAVRELLEEGVLSESDFAAVGPRVVRATRGGRGKAVETFVLKARPQFYAVSTPPPMVVENRTAYGPPVADFV